VILAAVCLMLLLLTCFWQWGPKDRRVDREVLRQIRRADQEGRGQFPPYE